MANGLDKLERLFSTKRKHAPIRHTAGANMYGSAPDPFNFSQAPAQAQPQQPQQQQQPSFESQLQLQPQPESPPCHFPPVPFIRPKANVMQPRNELRVSSPHSIGRTNSSSSRSHRLSTTFSFDSSNKDAMSDRRRQSAYSTTASFHIPSRTSSLLSRRHDRAPSGLVQLHLPRETTTPEDFTPPSGFPDASAFPLKEDNPATQKYLLDALPIYPASRVETPPPSDQDEFRFPSPPERGRKPSTTLIQLTPEPSPEMNPRRDSLLSEPKSSGEIQSDTTSSPSSRRFTRSSVPLLEDDWRDSYIHDPQETVSPKTRVVVHEPQVDDFLALTDEDLAEIRIEHPSKPPLRRAPPPPVLPPSARLQRFASTMRNSTPNSPAVASSQVAAWEAARIAKKYDFDVVYVANFWPSRMNHLHSPHKPATAPTTSASSPTSAVSAVSSADSSFTQSLPGSLVSSPTSDHPNTTTRNITPPNSVQGPASLRAPPTDIFASPPAAPAVADCCPNSGARVGPGAGAMSGCLLAGYGLETIAAPFRLSSRVHKKILRTEGWIEHRRSDAKENEFARGYARAFYTGTTAAAGAPATPAAAATLRRSSAPGSVSNPASEDMTPAAAAGRSNDQGRRNINRGIVFVAYRRPRGPGGTVNSSTAELDALEKEAETLVELILDFHKERRRWESFEAARRESVGTGSVSLS